MQLAIISDLHSNTKALKAVLKHIEDVAPQAPIICLGDLFECTVSKKKAQHLRNVSLEHAAITSEKFQKLLRFLTIRGNQEERIAQVTGLEKFEHYPETITIDDLLFIHGHQFEWSVDWTPTFPNYPQRIIFFGHSHQAAYYVDDLRILAKPNAVLYTEHVTQSFINVGSVVDHLEWALYDTVAKTVTFKKVGY